MKLMMCCLIAVFGFSFLGSWGVMRLIMCCLIAVLAASVLCLSISLKARSSGWIWRTNSNSMPKLRGEKGLSEEGFKADFLGCF
jgi:hypothetical protein